MVVAAHQHLELVVLEELVTDLLVARERLAVPQVAAVAAGQDIVVRGLTPPIKTAAQEAMGAAVVVVQAIQVASQVQAALVVPE